MSEEHKAKLKAGREAAAARKKVAAPEPAPVVKKLDAGRGFECWFSYSPSIKETLAKGHRVITDPDDPRWEDELVKPPFNGSPMGYFEICEVTRVDGEVVKKSGKHGGPCHMNRAREQMYLFRDMVKAGASQPWDFDHFYREQMAAAEKAKADGRIDDLKMLAKIMKEALNRTPEVSA